jgi:hypothetical protein
VVLADVYVTDPVQAILDPSVTADDAASSAALARVKPSEVIA